MLGAGLRCVVVVHAQLRRLASDMTHRSCPAPAHVNGYHSAEVSKEVPDHQTAPLWPPFAVSELIFEPLIEHIKRQGGKVQVRRTRTLLHAGAAAWSEWWGKQSARKLGARAIIPCA